MNDFAKDPDDHLYSPDVRAALAGFTRGEDTGVLEAAAAVRVAARSLDQLRSHGTGSRGLGPGALDILIRLSTAEANIKDLAASAGVTSRNVTGLVDTLERAGHAARVPDPRDRRSVLVRITEDGRTWLGGGSRRPHIHMARPFTRL